MNLQAWSLLGFESDHHHENKNPKTQIVCFSSQQWIQTNACVW